MVGQVEMKRQGELVERYTQQIGALRKHHESDTLLAKVKSTCKTTAADSELIRLWILHLAKLCTKSIDTRYILSNNPAEEVEISGVKHFLDEEASSRFYAGIRIYGGNYTLGVYEEVMADVKRRAEQEERGTKFNEISFKPPIKRREERINLNVKVELDVKSKSFPAVTIDASKKGLLVRTTSDAAVQNNDEVKIDINLDLLGGESKIVSLSYRVVTFRKEGGLQSIALERLATCQCIQFDSLLVKYIEKNKSVNRIDVDNVLGAVKKRLIEQAYINQAIVVSLALDSVGRVSFGLATDQNSSVRKFFDNASANALHCMLEQVVSSKLRETDELYIAVFSVQTDKNRALFACDVNEVDLATINTMRKYAKSNKSFQVLKATKEPVEQSNELWGSTLPDNENAYSLDYHVTQKARTALDNVADILRLVDVTELYGARYEPEVGEKDQSVIKAMRIDIDSAEAIDWVMDKTYEKRKEFRFKISERVHMTFKPVGSENRVTVYGETENISTKGMKVKMVRPATAIIGAHISVKFPDNMDLPSEVIYQAVSQSGGTISLRLVDNEDFEEVSGYWYNRIYRDIEQISVDDIIDMPFGLDKGFRSIIATNSDSVPVFYKVRDNIIMEVNFAVSQMNKNHIININDGVQRESLLLSKPLEVMVQRIAPKSVGSEECFTIYVKEISPTMSRMVVRNSESMELESRKEFLKSGGRCIQVRLKRVGDSVYRYFKGEVEYIRHVNSMKACYVEALAEAFDVYCQMDDVTALEKKRVEDLREERDEIAEELLSA